MKSRIGTAGAMVGLFFSLLCLPVSGRSQNVFYCFVAPTSFISTNFRAPLDSTGCPSGYAVVEITNANKAKFDSFAPPNLKYVYKQLQRGRPLRNNIDLVLKNSAGAVYQVVYYLVDDRTGLSGAARDTGHIFMDYTHLGKKYVWPAANNSKSTRRAGKFLSWVMFGEHQLQFDQSQRIGSMAAVDELALHETSHTQFTGSWTKWGGIGGKAVTYGADGMHYTTEMLGDQEGALNEGLATFYGFLMNDSAYQEMVGSLTDTSRRFFIEARSVLAGDNELRKIKNRSEVNLKNEFYPDGRPVVAFFYDWRTVPGWYLLFAEGTSIAFFSLFRNHTYLNKDTALSMLRGTSTAMSTDRKKRFLTYSCNQLALRMERYNNSSKGAADKSKLSSMFPYALLDLLTHFGMSDTMYKADHRRANPEKYSKAYGEYWNHRAAVKALVLADINASPIKFNEALQKIKDYFKKPDTMLPL